MTRSGAQGASSNLLRARPQLHARRSECGRSREQVSDYLLAPLQPLLGLVQPVWGAEPEQATAVRSLVGLPLRVRAQLRLHGFHQLFRRLGVNPGREDEVESEAPKFHLAEALQDPGAFLVREWRS